MRAAVGDDHAVRRTSAHVVLDQPVGSDREDAQAGALRGPEGIIVSLAERIG